MRLYLKNIGAIKEADVKLDGLTVIAGENDTGKSTVLKTLFSVIKSDNISKTSRLSDKRAKEILAIRFNLVFDANVSKNGQIVFFNSKNEVMIDVEVKDNNYVKKFYRKADAKERFFDATFIQSPLIFDFIDFFNSVSKMRESKKFDLNLNFNIKYPYTYWDLYDKLTTQNIFPAVKTQKVIDYMISNLINGKFVVEKSGEISYFKNINNKAEKIKMFNTASGIKSFGVIQLLNQNRFLDKKYVLLIDEPEVHLHPKWQLEYAKLIIELVKKGIKIIIASHSPYMIEALYVFALKEKVVNNFYLAENGLIKEQDTIENIFEKLVEPIRELKRYRLENI